FCASCEQKLTAELANILSVCMICHTRPSDNPPGGNERDPFSLKQFGRPVRSRATSRLQPYKSAISAEIVQWTTICGRADSLVMGDTGSATHLQNLFRSERSA